MDYDAVTPPLSKSKYRYDLAKNKFYNIICNAPSETLDSQDGLYRKAIILALIDREQEILETAQFYLEMEKRWK